MKSYTVKIKEHLQVSNIDEASQLLHELLSLDIAKGIESIHREQLLMTARLRQQRTRFARAYMSSLIQLKASSVCIQEETIYIAFADLVSGARDSISERAENEAQLLSGIGFEKGAELCCIAVVQIAKRFLEKLAEERDLGPNEAIHSEHRHEKALDSGRKITEIAFEMGGIYQLLPPMLAELHRACENPTDLGQHRPLIAIRAAQRIARVAEAWQICSDLRQRVALGIDRVSRVERGPIIYLEPRNVERKCRALVAKRRMALIGMIPQPEGEIRRVFLPMLVPIAAEVYRDQMPQKLRAIEADEIVEELVKYIASHALAVDWTVIASLSVQKDVQAFGWALLCVYLYVVAVQIATNKRRRGLSRAGIPYIKSIMTSRLVSIVAQSARVDANIAQEAIDSIIWRPSAGSTDLSTTPLIRFANGQIGLVALPGGTLNAFQETRRLLSSRRITCKYTGVAYERYIGRLLARAGVDVYESSFKLKREGKAVTDIDVLGYKDGVVFVVQAKYMAEPDSHYAMWKGQQEIAEGVRQCMVARDYILRDPGVLKRAFKTIDLEQPIEICCIVVCSAFTFSSDGFWPVFVIDDPYLHHLVDVRVSRVFDNQGEVVESIPIFDGAEPTGQELRDRIMMPEYMRYYRGVNLGLICTTTSLPGIIFREFSPVDTFAGETATHN